MKPKMKIGIVGAGAIGKVLIQALVKGAIPHAVLVGVFDQDPNKQRFLRAKKIKTASHLSQLVSRADLVIEAAGAASLPDIAEVVLKHKKALLVMSVGALLNLPQVIKNFQHQACQLYFPSGAIAGLDALKAAKAGGRIKTVKLVTTKPPRGLAGAPFFTKRQMDPNKLKRRTIIFTGNARQAVALFPANVNVAAAVALIGIGPQRTQVEIVADPRTDKNTHRLSIEGAVGRIECVTENVPSPQNHQTSYLAATSALALLQSIAGNQRLGT